MKSITNASELDEILNSIALIKANAILLKHKEFIKLDGCKKQTMLIVNRVFGDTSQYLDELQKINIEQASKVTGALENSIAWGEVLQKVINVIELVQADIKLSKMEHPVISRKSKIPDLAKNVRVFIVHGHNEEMKINVARVVEKLSLEPIILHELANKGQTIIEKFTDHANVSFAIVLLSADDVGHSIMEEYQSKKFRARQNVILELGFFLGKLGRERVAVLFETKSEFEFPSDYYGVLYIPYDKAGRWKFDLVRELKACDFDVDANSVI